MFTEMAQVIEIPVVDNGPFYIAYPVHLFLTTPGPMTF